MKIKGQDLIDFFKAWPPGENVYYDDLPYAERETDSVLCELEDLGDYGNPVDPLEDYDVSAGILGWQGVGPKPGDFDGDFERVLYKWLKGRTKTTLIVEVLKEEKDAAIELLKSKGWKVRE